MDNFHAVLQDHTAGSPMTEEVIWTDLTATDSAAQWRDRGLPVSVHSVEQLLEADDYHRRKAQKELPLDQTTDRDAQFQNLAQWKQEYLNSANPLLSMDTKQRELLGNCYRAGKLLTRQTRQPFDHDCPSDADGVVIPPGRFDPRRNRGYVPLGRSHDTSAFAGDCLADWGRRCGQVQYPEAKSLLLWCAGGGSNSAQTQLFKADLQALVNQLGFAVRVAHDPPYTSKYHPLEHR